MGYSEKIVFNPRHKAKQGILHYIENFNAEGQTLKQKRNVLKRIEFEGRNYIIKSFKPPHLINKVVYKFFRPSKAKRSFEFALMLLERNINTPEPIVYIERSDSLGLTSSYYISEEINYDLTYRELIHEPEFPDRANILRQFTAFTFKLHENNILFEDHSPGNTLIVKRQGVYDFYLVDLNRMKIMDLDFDKRMKNFVRLYPTPDMVEIMSDEYARLYGRDFGSVHGKMQSSFDAFRSGYERKKAITRPLKKLFK